YERPTPLTLAMLRTAIPANAALVEFAAYHPFNPKASETKAYGDQHYAAYILRQQGPVQWKELGDARTVDAAVEQLRRALRDPKRSDVKKLARAVHARVMEPLQELIGDATKLLVSPDGELNLIPLEALVDAQNRYLVERYSFSYVTGRDLLRLRIA